MAKVQSSTTKKARPALTPEARENQLISMAMNAAEEQLLNGTASSQIIVHFLKLGCQKAELEKEKLKRENQLLSAKTESLNSSKRIEELYENALNAMKIYSGDMNDDDSE